jgi:alpha-1,4-digalacturonate transport system substrate-binding protein
VNHDQFTNGVPYLTPRLGAEVNYGPYAEQYNVFLDEIANTDNVYITDWLNQVMIPGMYPILNLFVENAADPLNTKTALQLLTDLEAALKAVAPTA